MTSREKIKLPKYLYIAGRQGRKAINMEGK
jgi:hypothetical protein